MPLGSALEVLVDHEPATRNLSRSARAWGQDVTCVAPADTPGVWRIVLEKRVP